MSRRRDGRAVSRFSLWSGIFIALATASAPVSVKNAIADSFDARMQGIAPVEIEDAVVRHLTVTQFKSRTIRLSRPFSSTVIGSPAIVDVLPLSDRALYIQGKKVGTTNVSLFDQDKRVIAVLDIDVVIDAANVSEQIRASTGATGIRVSSVNGQIVLRGNVLNAVIADQAVSIAKSANPNVPIVNAMHISAAQQVMLKVRYLEVTRDAERDLGVNWFVANGAGNRGLNTGLGTPTGSGNLVQTPPTLNPPSTPGALPLFQAVGTFAGSTTSLPFGVAIANLVNNSAGSVDAMITALEQKGAVRELAEPDLVALSGDTASFLAGGEIPVPSVQSTVGATPTISVEYKPFGVQLTFMPTVLANGIINLRLTPSVSQLDFTNGIIISGFTIPALTKREARTTVELRDGQSFAIAGLLQNEGRRNISQLPWIGSVPVLGTLFRSTSFQQQESDLVVIVTPHLVAPAAPGQRIATPLDETLPGNDVDMFLLGQEEVRKQQSEPLATGGHLPGPSGYIMPADPN
jgi:pilus assembly protein CpaC